MELDLTYLEDYLGMTDPILIKNSHMFITCIVCGEKFLGHFMLILCETCRQPNKWIRQRDE